MADIIGKEYSEGYVWNLKVKDSTGTTKTVGVKAVALDEDLIDTTIGATSVKIPTSGAVKAYVADEVGKISTVTLKKVDKLPDTGESNIIYLVPKTKTGTQNVYNEYIWQDGAWELIGDTEVDLSNYYTKTEVNTELAKKVDKVDGKGLSTNDYTTAEKTKLEGIQTGATKVEASETNGNIKINGSETTVYTETPSYTSVKVGDSTATATADKKTIEFAAGTGISLATTTSGAGNPTVTITATGTEAKSATVTTEGIAKLPVYNSSTGCIDLSNSTSN